MNLGFDKSAKNVFLVSNGVQLNQSGGLGFESLDNDNSVMNGFDFSPCSNRGGNSATEHKECDFNHDLHSKIDWFSCTLDFDKTKSIESFVHTIYVLMCHLFDQVLPEKVVGILGYETGIKYHVNCSGRSVVVARFDYGGERFPNRCRIDISGTGCTRVDDWQVMYGFLSTKTNVKLTRIDLAVDFLNGEYNVDDAVEWYNNGEFNSGGRQPRHSTVGDWLTDKSKNGRTLEVGRRKNGKMIRVYEKGKQLGRTESEWVRFEVEIRNIDRTIPLDILINPDTYFAGAHKCLQKIITSGATKIATEQKGGEISMEHLVKHCSNAYGRLIHVARVTMNADDIINMIEREGVPSRLERSTLLNLFELSPTDNNNLT